MSRDKTIPGMSKAAQSRPVEIIYGLHAAEAALLNIKRTILQVHCTENAHNRLHHFLRVRGITPNIHSTRALNDYAGAGAVHQGVVVIAEPLPHLHLTDFLRNLDTSQNPVLLAMLDQVTDPHNAGAVLRSAAAFSVGALIVQTRHSPETSPIMAKAASGGIEHVPLIETVNLARALEQLKTYDFYCIGLDSAAPDTLARANLKLPRLCFIFGAEGKGIRRLVRQNCNAVYSLPVSGAIRSLNVSNAAAIAFYEASKNREI
jgi:23S rRNA (guanosine2251-2'-O)-methyltransferase